MFDSTFEIAQRKSDSWSIRRFRDFVFDLNHARKRRLAQVRGRKCNQYVSAATATRGYEPYIVAQNAFRLFSAKNNLCCGVMHQVMKLFFNVFCFLREVVIPLLATRHSPQVGNSPQVKNPCSKGIRAFRIN